MKRTYTLSDIHEIAKWVLDCCNSKILLFDGPMGTGKTTLIKAMSKELGVTDMTSSPTFSLVNEYHSNTDQIVYHFDFYRIEIEDEAYDMGVEEYFESGAWCFIEWPEKVQNLLPLDSDVIKLTINTDNSRTLEIN